MTREEFIKGYCERSNTTWDELSKFYEALPCDCDYEKCQGWQMRSRLSIAFDAEIERALYPEGMK